MQKKIIGYDPCIPILDSFPEIKLSLVAPEPVPPVGLRELAQHFYAFAACHGIQIPSRAERARMLQDVPAVCRRARALLPLRVDNDNE